jgi:tetratricopeptide (TPR) repeat protein
MTTTPDLAPDTRMSALLAKAGGDPAGGMRDLDALLAEYPRDPRLHFLKGSLLAGLQDFAGARVAMRRAVDIAPDFVVARFQLGFLLLTSGEPHAAQEAWGPLHALAADHYLRLFVNGLCHLIRDEFEDTIRDLKDGIARNSENPPMNRDMQMIIDEAQAKLSEAPDGQAPVSSVDFLLQQSAYKTTRH